MTDTKRSLKAQFIEDFKLKNGEIPAKWHGHLLAAFDAGAATQGMQAEIDRLTVALDTAYCETCAERDGIFDRPPPAEPKCERCGVIDYDGKHPIPAHKCNGVDGAQRHGYANACTVCGRFSAQQHDGCPPASPEPAESEGKDTMHEHFVNKVSDKLDEVTASLIEKGLLTDDLEPPTAPPASSVDAKALEDARAFCDRYFNAECTQRSVDAMADFAIEYAAKQIDAAYQLAQEMFAEYSANNKELDADLQDWTAFIYTAMQAVKERRAE